QKFEPMRLTGDKLIADIEPAPDPTTKPAGAPAPAGGGPGDFGSKVQFKNVHIQGNVEVKSGGLWVTADSIDYKPVKNRLYIRAEGRNRVHQRDLNTGLDVAMFDEFEYDTQTNLIVNQKGFIMLQRK